MTHHYILFCATAVSALSDSDGKAGGIGGLSCLGDSDDAIAPWSNYGKAVDVAAPGGTLLWS
jgi:subtilisin